mgnify:CR=1 FL=1
MRLWYNDGMRILLIDDDRSLRFVPAAAEVIVARTSAAALKVLEKDIDFWDEVWFDHDLGLLSDGKEDDTLPVLSHFSYLAVQDTPVPVGKLYVHTGNNVGQKALVDGFRRYGYRPIVGVDLKSAFVVPEKDTVVFQRGWDNRV